MAGWTGPERKRGGEGHEKGGEGHEKGRRGPRNGAGTDGLARNLLGGEILVAREISNAKKIRMKNFRFFIEPKSETFWFLRPAV